MTNFEKWKQDLTYEKWAKIIDQMVCLYDCKVCPVKPKCKPFETTLKQCYKNMKAWAAKCPD